MLSNHLFKELNFFSPLCSVHPSRILTHWTYWFLNKAESKSLAYFWRVHHRDSSLDETENETEPPPLLRPASSPPTPDNTFSYARSIILLSSKNHYYSLLIHFDPNFSLLSLDLFFFLSFFFLVSDNQFPICKHSSVYF